MGFWSDLGSSIATSGGDIATNTIGGIINAGINKELGDYERQQNYKYNEKAADNADKRARAQFRDMYSYSAQVQEMKKAGLNPALMYGGASGQGGASAPQGMGAGGVQKGLSGMNLMSLAEIEVMKSQANLNNAEAENLNKDTDKKGAEISEIFARIANINQNTLNQKEQQKILQLDATLKDIQVLFESATLQGNIDKVYNEADYLFHLSRKTYEDSRNSHLQANFSEQSFMLRLNELELSNFQILCDAAQKMSQVELNQAQVLSLMAHVGIDLYNAVINHGKLILESDKLNAQIKQWAKENHIAEEQIKALKTGNWLRFAGTMFQSFSYVMGAGISAAGNVASHKN